ncbi:MAG: ATP-binding protein [Bacteroidales bacterium]|nr:ATP-binding protein [Candidatus Cryptobacteroides aphodequi]
MLFRKFTRTLEEFLQTEPDKILLVNGARQVGKSYLISYVSKKLFKNYVEINLKEDKEGDGIFASVNSTDDFYLQLGAIAGDRLGKRENTIVFLDEIQAYPHLLTMLKFLNQEKRYRYIASGSQLGVALAETPSVPLGSIAIKEMYPLDFEEFLISQGCGQETIEAIEAKFKAGEPLNEAMHAYMMKQFRLYLLVGGLPDAVKTFNESRNIAKVREIQKDIHDLYGIDASQYDEERKLVIRRIYKMIPSNMENKKKRVFVNDIEETKAHRQFSDYAEEFEYLTNSGIAIGVQAISNPKFPLKESEEKNLLKLYMNDVGLLTNLLYSTNINAVLQDQRSVNLGSVYETVVAQELKAHGFMMNYYDNKQKGEVDFLVDDYQNLTVLPIEVKSGKDYDEHSALDRFLNVKDYGITNAIVLCNEREIRKNGGVTYMPVYYCMFYRQRAGTPDMYLPEIDVPLV